jgi:hypothetical protein
MRKEFQISLICAIASSPAGLAMSIAMEYFPFLKGHPGGAFWSSFGVTIFLLIVAAIIAVRGERAAEREGAKKRMIPLIGMILFGIGFIGCASWYFWPTSNTVLVVEGEQSKKQLSIPISITPLPEPGYARYSGLYPNFGETSVPKGANDPAKYDPPILGIGDVYISNTSLSKSVTLRIFLRINGYVKSLDNEGYGPVGRRMGRDDWGLVTQYCGKKNYQSLSHLQ